MHRAYSVRGAVGISNLTLAEVATPVPGPDDVLIRIRAVSLNYRDLDTVRGTYPGGKYDLPFTPTSDAAGEVVAIGNRVTNLRLGDRVVPNFWQKWQTGETPPPGAVHLAGALPGLLRELAVLPAAGLLKIPEGVSFAEASTLPIAAVTAWQALIEIGGLKPGETVLVQGTGGVSIFALQIAKLAGAKVIVTSSSDEKLERARKLGADFTINYRTQPDWASEVRRWTGDHGVQHVIEVGGASTFRQSLQALAIGGHVYVIGYLGGAGEGIDPFLILKSKAHVHGVLVGPASSFQAFLDAYTARGLRPVIDRVFPFENAVDAFRHMESATHFGKIVIEV